jgi:hypothetical protein
MHGCMAEPEAHGSKLVDMRSCSCPRTAILSCIHAVRKQVHASAHAAHIAPCMARVSPVLSCTALQCALHDRCSRHACAATCMPTRVSALQYPFTLKTRLVLRDVALLGLCSRWGVRARCSCPRTKSLETSGAHATSMPHDSHSACARIT